MGPTLGREHWRKSNQWFALTARHAQLVLDDTAVAEAFSKCALLPHPAGPPMSRGSMSHRDNLLLVTAPFASRSCPCWCCTLLLSGGGCASASPQI